MDQTYLEFTDGISHKFYEVSVDGETLTVRYGRIGDAGQSSTKTFETAQKAQAEAQKKLAEKRKSGYAEAVQGEREKAAVPKPARVPKLQIVGFIEVTEPITQPITKFGGQPVWLEEPRWPLSTETGTPLPFLCQIRLEPHLFGEIDARMAYIFFGHSYGESDGFTDGESAVALQPGNLLWRVEWGDVRSPAFALSATGLTTIRKDPSVRGWRGTPVEFSVSLEAGSDPLGASFDEMDEKGWSQSKQDDHCAATSGHKVGGTPRPEFSNNGIDGELDDWNLLLQLEPCFEDIEGLDVSFGDGGCGWWWLSKDAKRFDYTFSSN